MRIGNIEVDDLRETLAPNGAYAWRELGDIDLLIVHHSGVDVDSTADQIHAYHRDTLGWPGIGYHFLIHWDGRSEYTGDILTVRYHAGPHNRRAIGICLTGNFNQRPPAQAQLDATRDLLANLQLALGWPIPIVGHHEIASTACPGDTFLRKQPYWGSGVRGQGS
ncbi:MAG: N-acetylmuramoyl-L-alanine amidase [Chloroflexi bacterium]|nr:N-acetylmuramoyl-L-alanine amidase [Chloroflexota bacterium]